MAKLAIIGGTGLSRMQGLEIERREMVKTPYGAPSCPMLFGTLNGVEVVFLARHGSMHHLPPHRINYQANLWALQSVGIESIIAVGAVGGIAEQSQVGVLVVPDQLIDYTHDRPSTFYNGAPEPVLQIDFAYPYSDSVRQALIDGAQEAGVPVLDRGVYGVSQGPRFETAAEVVRMERDGCTLVGMTGMPEAVLARELNIDYACLAVVVNRAAGLSAGGRMDLEGMPQRVSAGMELARKILAAAVRRVD